ncbi:MAG: DNA polymerase II [Verrucomicrobia bacterium]|nr:DNA polymerase II [Verrucomicrobiota bacterium]
MIKDPSDNRLIFGHHPGEGLVAVELTRNKDAADEITRFVRAGNALTQEKEPFKPFIWLVSPDLLSDSEIRHGIHDLSGKGAFKYRAEFDSWKDCQDAVKFLRRKTGQNPSSGEAPYYYLTDPVQQYLLLTGRTLFKGLKFGELKRLQVDIETYTTKGYEFPNAEREEDRIIAIALADETGWTEVLSGAELDEKALLQKFVEIVKEKDPDVIEGHNIFRFDLPFIATRAKRHKVKMTLGRDGSTIKSRPGRFIAGERSITYPKFDIFGRHVIDTLFLVQLYDITNRALEGFGLKEVAIHFGVAPEGRTYIEGAEIASMFDKDPSTLMDYACDDIIETREISNILSPIYFAQAQILPFSYQNVSVRGNGAKIDSLLLREYVRRDEAIPYPDIPREFAGGYTDVFVVGVEENVHHCDVRSLYPSLMLTQQLCPRTDELRIFLELLDYLRSFRIDAKTKMQNTKNADEKVYLDALQSTFKILINSFYGYLGFRQARFSDFSSAEKVAYEGRQLLKQMIKWLDGNGAKTIEIDTDGIYFVPPPFKSDKELKKFRADFEASLPEGIDIEFDAEYKAMFSYKMKNYALLDEHDEVIIKGAALKSRGLERFQREFLREMLRLKLERNNERIGELHDQYRKCIEEKTWPIQMLAKTETLQDAPATYAEKIKGKSRGRNAAYELALNSGRAYQAGDQISYYVTGAKKSVAVYEAARSVAEWDPDNRDENVPYYVAKLEALYKKFATIENETAQQELGLGG